MRVALTGGATGIGASVAAKLKAQCATVVAFDLNEPQANVDEWIKIDLGDNASISDAAGRADGLFDALINNAGLPPREGLTELVLRVNYFGLRQFTDAMVDKLSPGGAIVNTASRAGSMWRDNIDQVKALMALRDTSALADFISGHGIDHIRAYNLSKEAVIVHTIAQCEALLKRNLRANSVSPAAVSTGILDDFKSAFGARVDKAIEQVGRAGTADEVADLICFLAGPESHWIKGQDITIDGGMTALAVTEMLGLKEAQNA
ncbi:MAG: coniferyl-alcohol dehydrogenase [Pseudomonadota bacterium]